MSKDPVLSFIASPFMHRKPRFTLEPHKKPTKKKRVGGKKVVMYAAYPCKRCGRKIRESQLIIALGHYWHKKCWTKEKNRRIKITTPTGTKKFGKIGW